MKVGPDEFLGRALYQATLDKRLKAFIYTGPRVTSAPTGAVSRSG